MTLARRGLVPPTRERCRSVTCERARVDSARRRGAIRSSGWSTSSRGGIISSSSFAFLRLFGGRALVTAVTAFTVSHSLLLAAVTFGWSPLAPGVVEALIALSIAFLAAEVLRCEGGRSAGRFVAAAFGFGLLHAMGLAGALADLELPRADLPLALGFFNLGVELGQLLFVALVFVAAWGWRRLR